MNVKCIPGIYLTKLILNEGHLFWYYKYLDLIQCVHAVLLKLLIEQVILEKCIITLGLHTFMLYGLKIGHYFTYLIV